MGNFVRPAEIVLKISGGDTLTVRQQLNTGEVRARFARMSTLDQGRRFIDPINVDVATVIAYLLDWSLTDENGQRVPIRDLAPDQLISTLNDLTYDRFKEIKTAIEMHENAIEAAAEEKKRTTDGAIASSTISTLPAAAAGDMSGSLN